MTQNKLRTCLQDPISELYDAARYLDAAVTAHLSGEKQFAEELIRLSDMPVVREWTESIWGAGGIYTDFQKTLGEPKTFPKEDRDPVRMPDNKGEKALLERDGFQCRFCGIPVIRKEVRNLLKKQYPVVLPWGSRNMEQHAAFQALWVQYDHVQPHARGGKTSLDNMVITCAPCNYGRMNYLLEEVDLEIPDLSKNVHSMWDGLERIFYK